MKPSVKLSLFGMAFVILFTTYVCNARAVSIEDCTRQEGCVGILLNNQVVVYRKGVLKGTISNIGSGDGTIRVENGWITVGRNNPYTYLYNIETGDQCEQYVEFPCTEGVVWLHPTDPAQDYAFYICPMNDSWVRVPVDCSAHLHISTSGSPASSITLDDERIYMLSNTDGRIIHYSPLYQSSGVAHTFESNTNELRYWNNSIDASKLIMTTGDNISLKDMPVSDGNPTALYTLPTGAGPGHMAISDTHILTSKEGANDAYLFEIENPASHLLLPVTDSREVALSKDKAFVIELGGQVVVQVFDTTTGTLVRTISEAALDIATIKPTLPPVCPDNLVEPGEVCDGTDFDGITCQNYGFDGGDLSCSVSCDTIFTSGCYSCGDGVINPGESCDGTNMDTASCSAAGYANGDVSCTASCTVDYGQCYTCGNGLIEGIEQCEGADLNGGTCSSAGFVDGTLSCGGDCMFDTSACHMCGNAITEAGETCDGTNTPGNICQTLDLGYTGGELICTSACDGLDDSGCYTCGDGNVDLTEECDGTNLNSQDCGTLGLGSGTLSCFENCSFNYSQCSGVPTEYCGNNTIDPGEECDDGNRSNNDDCSEFCKIIAPTCGLGGVDPGETCDGTDLNGETCETLGYQAGVLYCGGDCQVRTDDCHFTSTPQTISLQLDAEPDSGELNPELSSQYADLKATLTPRCVSQEVNGDLVLTTVEGSYCAVRATDYSSPEGKKMFSFIYLPENALEDEAPVLRFYQTGTIAQNFGGNITAYQGLQVKTVLVQDRLYHVTQERLSSMGMKFLAIHPETQSRGRWLAVTIGTGSTSLCTDEQGENCAQLVPDQGQLIFNLAALEDVPDFNFTPPTDNSGCNCTTGSNSSNSIPLLLLLGITFLFWNRRNRMK